MDLVDTDFSEFRHQHLAELLDRLFGFPDVHYAERAVGHRPATWEIKPGTGESLGEVPGPAG